MLLITGVSPQKKNPNRFNVFLDGKYAFSAARENILKYHLKTGGSLDKGIFEKIVFDENFEEIYGKVLRFLSYRVRSEKEVEERLKKYLEKSVKSKTARQEIMEKVLKRLKDLSLVDDEQFALSYVEGKIKSSKGLGKRIVARQLLKKGISEDLVEKNLSKYDLGVELKKAFKLAEKKARITQGRCEVEIKGKVYRYLYGKGFSTEVIQEAIRKVFSKY